MYFGRNREETAGMAKKIYFELWKDSLWEIGEKKNRIKNSKEITEKKKRGNEE